MSRRQRAARRKAANRAHRKADRARDAAAAPIPAPPAVSLLPVAADVGVAEDALAEGPVVAVPPAVQGTLQRSLRYPIEQRTAFVVLAVLVAVVRVVDPGFWTTAVVTRLLLASFALGALVRVAEGSPRFVRPSFGNVRLAAAVLTVSFLPLLLTLLFVPAVHEILLVHEGAPLATVHAQEEPPEVIGPGPGEVVDTHASMSTLVVVGLAMLWKFAMVPAGLVVAATTSSFFATLNPLAVFPAMRALGDRSRRAARIYAAIVLVQALAGVALDLVAWPVVSPVLKSVVDAYGWLAVGCALGLAMWRRRRWVAVEEEQHEAPLEFGPDPDHRGL